MDRDVLQEAPDRFAIVQLARAAHQFGNDQRWQDGGSFADRALNRGDVLTREHSDQD